jgi:glc operon protein GlcG
MRVRFSMAPRLMLLGLFVLGLSTPVLPDRAVAQQPSANPDYGLAMSNEQAKAVAAAALGEAKKNGWRIAVAVVGPAGELLYFEKMDGAQLAAADLAQGKARTSILFRRPSKAFADQFAAGNTSFLSYPDKPVASEGGLPIVLGGKIVGAIGVSGGTGQQDGAAALAGASAAK